jgi:hypothetical protein
VVAKLGAATTDTWFGATARRRSDLLEDML